MQSYTIYLDGVPNPPASSALIYHTNVRSCRFAYDSGSSCQPLLKLAVARYQFETIHPFCDGNGRIGRILISAWLEAQRILTAPMLYIRAFFQQRQTEYYDNLLRVSTEGDWERWVLFFLEAVATQSKDSVLRAHKLADLRQGYHRRIDAAGSRSHKTHALLDELFVVPAISVPAAATRLGITYAAAKTHVFRLIDIGVLDPNPFMYNGVKLYFPRELQAAVEGSLEPQP